MTETLGQGRVPGLHRDDHHSEMPGWVTRKENGFAGIISVDRGRMMSRSVGGSAQLDSSPGKMEDLGSTAAAMLRVREI